VCARLNASHVVTRDAEGGRMCDDPSGNAILLAIRDSVPEGS
jgi:hypothetical protein